MAGGKNDQELEQEEGLTSLRVQKQRKGRKNSLSAWLFVAAAEEEHFKDFHQTFDYDIVSDFHYISNRKYACIIIVPSINFTFYSQFI